MTDEYGTQSDNLIVMDNTIPAYIQSHIDGADWLETDVRLSPCGELVLKHDQRATMRHERLRDLLLYFKYTDKTFLVEIKDSMQTTMAVIRLVNELEIDHKRVIIQSFCERCLTCVRTMSSMRSCLLMGIPLTETKLIYYLSPKRLRKVVKDKGYSFVGINHNVARFKSFMRRIKDVAVLVWTVNTTEVAKMVLESPNVKGIITDRPRHIRRFTKKT